MEKHFFRPCYQIQSVFFVQILTILFEKIKNYFIPSDRQKNRKIYLTCILQCSWLSSAMIDELQAKIYTKQALLGILYEIIQSNVVLFAIWLMYLKIDVKWKTFENSIGKSVQVFINVVHPNTTQFNVLIGQILLGVVKKCSNWMQKGKRLEKPTSSVLKFYNPFKIQLQTMSESIDSTPKPNTLKQSPLVPIIPVPQTGYIFPSPIQTSNPQIQYPQKLNNCYREYLKLFREHKLLKTQLNRVIEEKTQLQGKFNSLQVKLQNIQYERSDNDDKKKRHRRTANEIARDYNCSISGCEKSYGSEASLLQHIKIKHRQFYGSEGYEELLKSLPKKNLPQNINN